MSPPSASKPEKPVPPTAAVPSAPSPPVAPTEEFAPLPPRAPVVFWPWPASRAVVLPPVVGPPTAEPAFAGPPLAEPADELPPNPLPPTPLPPLWPPPLVVTVLLPPLTAFEVELPSVFVPGSVGPVLFDPFAPLTAATVTPSDEVVTTGIRSGAGKAPTDWNEPTRPTTTRLTIINPVAMSRIGSIPAPPSTRPRGRGGQRRFAGYLSRLIHAGILAGERAGRKHLAGTIGGRTRGKIEFRQIKKATPPTGEGRWGRLCIRR